MNPLRFLLLEDSAFDTKLIQAQLTAGEIDCELIQAATRTDFENALATDAFDLILSDYTLPDFDGIMALEMARDRCPQTPFIFVTATLGEAVAIETLKCGATDYVLKQGLERLVPSIHRALREAEERLARQQAETALDRREQEFRALVENSPDVISRVDRQLRYLYVNPAIERATGLKPEQLIGKTDAELGLPVEYQEWEAILTQVFATGKEAFFEFDFSLANSDRYYHLRAVPEFGQDGSVQSVLSIAREVTDYKRAEQALRDSEAQLRQQTEALRQANRVKDEFLAVLSHELRSPLNAILGWAQLLLSRKYDEARTLKALQTIERNARLQTQLVEDLLDISRIIQGKLNLAIAPVNLADPIEAAIDTMRLAAEAKSLNLVLAIESDVIVAGDSSRLQQVVWNLLSNAIKFTPQGGQIEVQLEKLSVTAFACAEHFLAERSKEQTGLFNGTGDNAPSSILCPTAPSESATSSRPGLRSRVEYAQITVRDTGTGIDSDFLPHIFEHFRQEDSTTTRSFGGLGLGLAIVRHLVELHGGTIQAYSSGEGQGTTFVIQFPLLNQASFSVKTGGTIDTFHTVPLQNSIASNTVSYSSLLAGLHILIVDDEADARHMLKFLVEQAGGRVTAVSSASAALQVLTHSVPDLLLSDVGMPEIDGYMLVQRVRALPPNRGGRIPAIALTAYSTRDDVSQALAAGFHTHVSKPIEPVELVKSIAHLAATKT